MGILSRLERPRPVARASGYAAAATGRLTASLQSEAEFINTTLRYQGAALRARSRQAAQNNPFARRFISMVVNNVAGPTPFRLQSKVKFKGGKLDDSANRKMEEEWSLWGRKGGCEISGRFSWNALQRLLMRVLATDGELLLRRYRGPEYGRHGYQLQIVDVDRLDDQKNKALAGGGAIHMGVELDAMSKPVAYHLRKRKPSQWGNSYFGGGESERVPAEDMLHVFIPDFAEQVRGVPWMYAALLNLVHLGAFEEAAVIAARIGAAQMGVIESPDGGKTLADMAASRPTADGTTAAAREPEISADPGSFAVLPPGYKMGQGWDPKYPDAAIEPFVKACLRGIAVGCDVAYHNLSGDMEGVNYSSARIAELDERDSWMTIQSFVAEHLHDDVHLDWLSMSVLTGALPFDLARLEKYRSVYWQAKRWAWVDPEKEVNAAVMAINNRLRSRTRVIAEGGEDIEDVFGELGAEEDMAKTAGIELPDPNSKPSGKLPGAPAAEPAKPAAADDEDKKEAGVRDVNVNVSFGASKEERDAREAHEKGMHQALERVANTPPIVKVAAPVVNNNIAAPVVKVENTVEPTPIQVVVDQPVEVNLTMPDRKSVSEIERNRKGDITRVTQTETSAT